MKQIVILSEGRPGIVADATIALGERGVNIASIDAETHQGVSVVRMTVSDLDLALRLLRDAGLHAFHEEVILVRVEDKPGALARIARRLKDAGLELSSLRIVSRDGAHGVAALSCDDVPKARALLSNDLLG
jgi:hypothetical protein